MTSGATPIPVHVALPRPSSQGSVRQARGRRQPETFADSWIDWTKHGLEPRWLGDESSDCAAALDPSTFDNHGADELERFLLGAHARNEIALVISTMGRADDHSPRHPFATHDASVDVGRGLLTHVVGRRSPAGTEPRLADDVTGADRDLGLRLRARAQDAPWWAMDLIGMTMVPGAGGPPTKHPAAGTLVPILVDGLGAPVVAVWISDEADVRIYLIPDQTDGNAVLDWLVTQALPEYVPGALRRARSPHLIDPSLETTGEAAARKAIADLDARYTAEREQLERELHAATTAAEPIRYGLLYGTGDELVAAVEAVLRAAGFTVMNLDDELGDTESADLLAIRQSHRRLIEVKSASGNAREQLVGALDRHLATWPKLRPDEPVDGGVLVVNHQYRKHPSERSARVYERAAFVESLGVEVVTSRDLFTWWAAGDWPAIRAAVLGVAAVADTAPASATPASARETSGSRTAGRRWRWPWKRDR